MPLVCVQPLQMSWARRSEDLTVDKTDDKDAVLIARLAAQLEVPLTNVSPAPNEHEQAASEGKSLMMS
jgi:hypothetical protein